MIIFTNINENNKIELTKEDLERLIKEAEQKGYNEGYVAGCQVAIKPSYYPMPYYVPNYDKSNYDYNWWNKPYITWTCSND